MERGVKGHRKGLWTEEEDRVLLDYIRIHGKGRWNRVAKTTGLKRCGKSCRLRWINYLSPSIKHGEFSEEEDDLIIRLHNLLGNRWSLIAGRVPGRTDNQVKNHWNTHLSKKLGVKKQRTKLKAPSETLPPEGKEVENASAPLDTSFELPSENNFRADDHKSNDDCAQSEAGCFRLDVPIVNEGCESPFWFTNDEIHLSTPTLTQLLDQYPLDNLFWHGL